MDRPASEVITARYSCRAYTPDPIPKAAADRLHDLLAASTTGPLGGRLRFALIAAAEGDTASLRGLGAYGSVKGATGWLVGAVAQGAALPEEYGYLMERAVLEATDLGLGTCWVGGVFTRSAFATRIGASAAESVPAIVATGIAAPGIKDTDPVRKRAGSSRRLAAELLFFEGGLGRPLDAVGAGDLAPVLELVRWAPSASNKQPWRVIKTTDEWHFHLARTPGYGTGTATFSLLRLADLQRLDVGIAMCHFELAARELGQEGAWVAEDPGLAGADDGLEYVASWVPRD